MGTLAALSAAAFVLGAGAGLLWKDPGLLLAQWTGNTQEVVWSDEASLAQDAAQGADDELLPAMEEPSQVAVELPSRAAAESSGEPEAAYQTASAEPVRPVAQTKQAPAKASPPDEARRAAPPPTTPAVSAAPPSGLAVQVGAFAERRSADQLIARLRSEGFPAYASAAEGGAWRVRVGPFRDRGGADKAAAQLEQQKLPTWVLEENGGR